MVKSLKLTRFSGLILLLKHAQTFSIPGLMPREFSYHDTLTIEMSSKISPDVDNSFFGSAVLAKPIDTVESFQTCKPMKTGGFIH